MENKVHTVFIFKDVTYNVAFVNQQGQIQTSRLETQSMEKD